MGAAAGGCWSFCLHTAAAVAINAGQWGWGQEWTEHKCLLAWIRSVFHNGIHPGVHVSKCIYLLHALTLPSFRPQRIIALCQWIGLLLLPRCASELHPLLWGNRTPQAAANRTNLLGLTDYGTDSCLHQYTFSSSPLTGVNRKRHYSRAFGTDVEGMLLTGLLESMKWPQASMWWINSRGSFTDHNPELLQYSWLWWTQKAVERCYQGEGHWRPHASLTELKEALLNSKERNCHREHKWPEITLGLGRGQRHQTPLWSPAYEGYCCCVDLRNCHRSLFCQCFQDTVQKLWLLSAFWEVQNHTMPTVFLLIALLPKCPNERAP